MITRNPARTIAANALFGLSMVVGLSVSADARRIAGSPCEGEIDTVVPPTPMVLDCTNPCAAGCQSVMTLCPDGSGNPAAECRCSGASPEECCHIVLCIGGSNNYPEAKGDCRPQNQRCPAGVCAIDHTGIGGTGSGVTGQCN